MLGAEADFEIVGEAGNGEEAVAAADQLRPDVVLMDLRMPGLDGAEATARITTADQDIKVLVLTTYDTDSDIVRAVEAGATGYLLKDTPRLELAAAIRAAARGETVLAPPVAARLVNRLRRRLGNGSRPVRPRYSPLSPADCPTPKSDGSCSSARQLSRHTCCASSPNSASTTALPPSPSPTNAAYCQRQVADAEQSLVTSRRRSRGPISGRGHRPPPFG